MSTTIDSRVVEMRFDNKEFEANARDTIQTLNNLKQALNEDLSGNAFESLDRAARNVDLSSIEKNLDAITDRFSTMGIVGMRVIENLTDGILNKLTGALNKAFDAIKEGGFKRASNIENARFQLKGLIDDQDEVNKIMDQARESVDLTAFAYDEAAKAASMFAATGMRSGEEMMNALKGISGVAAMTSSDYEGISRIFTTVAGNGRLMGDQLLQLSTRGLNAAATLRDFFNKVAQDSSYASENVTKAVQELMGMEALSEEQVEARKKALDEEYKAASKQFDQEYELRKKTLDKEYKALQKSLNEEYAIKKTAYDNEYKALQKSLDAEIKAQQKANSARIEEANKAYQQDVKNFQEATNAKIALIDQEYMENLKLIDEDAYNRMKAIDDEIKGINDAAEAEEKARRDAERAATLAELNKAVSIAKTTKTRQEAEEALAAYQKQIADEDLAESRKTQIEKLQEQKEEIKEEAQLKKDEAKEKRDAAVQQVQTEAQATLEAMAEKHQKEMEELRESLQAQIDAMQESKTAKLTTLREGQTEELEVFKEGQNAQLEAYRENQNEELSALKETNKEKLSELKETLDKQKKELKSSESFTEITEEAIRDMVSKGLISFDIFAEAMGKTFGEHAKDADKTFQGSMANIRAALARTGEMFYAPLIEESGPLVNLFRTIKGKINDLNDSIRPFAVFITSWLNNDIIPRVTKFVEGINTNFEFTEKGFATIKNILESILNVGKFVSHVFGTVKDIFTELFHIDAEPFYKGSEAIKVFTESLAKFDISSLGIVKTLKSIAKLFRSLWNIVVQLVKAFTPLTKLFKSTNDETKKTKNTFAKLIESFANFLDTSPKVKTFFEILTKVIDAFANGLLIAKNSIKTFVDNLNSKLVGTNFVQGFIDGITDTAEKVYNAVKTFFTNVIDKIKEILKIKSPSQVTFEIGEFLVLGFIEGIKSLAEIAIKTIKTLFISIINTIKGIFTDFESENIDTNGETLGSNFILDFINGIKGSIPKAIDTIKEFFSNIKDHILNMNIGGTTGAEFFASFTESFEDNPSPINIILGLVKAIATLGLIFGSLGTEVLLTVIQLFQKLARVFKILKSVKKEDIINFFNSILEASEHTGEFTLDGFLEGFEAHGSLVLTKVKEYFEKVLQVIKNVFGISSPAKEIIDIAMNILNTFVDIIKNFGGLIVDAVSNLFKILSKVIETGKNIFIKTFDFFKDNPSSLFAFVTGFGILIMMMKLVDKLRFAIEPLSNFGKMLNRLASAIKAYAVDTYAEAFLKVTVGLTVLLLAFSALIVVAKNVDTNKLGSVALIITAVGLALISIISSVGLLIKALADMKALNLEIFTNGKTGKENALVVIAQGIKKIMKEWSFSHLMKSFAKSVALIVGSFIGTILIIEYIGKDDVNKAIEVLKIAVISIAVIGVLGTIIASLVKKFNLDLNGVANDILKFGMTMLAMTGSLYLGVQAINDLFKLEDGQDTKTVAAKFGILVLLFTLIESIVGAFMFVSSFIISKKQQLSAEPILAFAALILVTMIAFNKFMKIDLSKIDKDKLMVFVKILIVIGALVTVFIWISNKSDGALKAGGFILSFAALLLTTMIALKKFMNIDLDKADKNKLIDFIGIIIVLGVLASLFAWISRDSKGALKAGGTVLALGVWLYAAIGAIAILGKFKIETLVKAIGAIIFLYIAMAIVLANTSDISPDTFKTVLSIAAALAMALIAISVFSTFKVEKLIPTVISMCLLLLSIGYAFGQLGKINSKEGTGKAFAMFAALTAIGVALYAVSLHDWLSIAATGASISGILLAYGKVFKDINKIKYKKGITKTFLLGLLSIIVIGGALFTVASLNWSSILTAGVSVAAVILAYGKVFKDISETTSTIYNMKAFVLGSVSLIGIGIALKLASENCNWASILASGASIATVIEAYADVFKKLNTSQAVSTKTIGKFLLGSLSLVIIAGTLWVASHNDWKLILAAGTAILEVILAYGRVFRKLDGVQVNTSTVLNFLLGSVALLLIGGVIAAVAYFGDWDDILAAGTAISSVIGTYGLVFNKIAGVEVNIKSIGAFLAGIVAVGAIGYILHQAEGQSWDTMLSTAVSIDSVMLTLAGVVKLISGIDGDWSTVGKGIALLAAATIAAVVVGVLLKQCEADDWHNMLGTAGSILVVLLGLVAIAGLLTLIGSGGLASIIGAGAGILILDGLIADIGAILYALNKLTDYDILKDGGEKLKLIGESIGGFFGAIAGGFTEAFLSGTANGLADIGKSLSDFMVNSEDFFEAVKELDENSEKKVGYLVNALLVFSTAELVDSISDILNVFNIFGGGLGKNFGAMGKWIKEFADGVSGVNAESAKNASLACLYLVKAINEFSVLDAVKLALLSKFGDSIKNFAKSIKAIFGPGGFNGVPDVNNYRNAADCMKVIISVADSIKSRDFRDAEDLEGFGTHMVTFAKILPTIEGYAKDLDEKAFDKLKTVSDKVIEIAGNIPFQVGSDSLLSKGVGVNDVGQFGLKLRTFAKYMGDMHDTTNGSVMYYSTDLKETPFMRLYLASGWVVKIAESVPTTVNSGLFGGKSNNIANFGSNVAKFAEHMQTIQKNIKDDLDINKFQNLYSVSKPLLDMANDLVGISKFGDDTKYINVGEQIKSFGEALKNFGENIKSFGIKANAGYIGFSGAVELLERLVDVMPSLMLFDGTIISTFFESLKANAASGMKAFLDQFEGKEANKRTTEAISTVFSIITQTVNSKKNLMESLGRITVKYFTGEEGISSQNSIDMVIRAMQGIMHKASTSVNIDAMKNLGIKAAQGFADGLVSREAQDRLGAMAERFGHMVYNKVKSALDIHSPSRKMAELGEFASLGFLNGFVSMTKEITDAGDTIADSATEGLRNALEKVIDQIQNQGDFNPIITPVLDLSNVTEEADKIGGILNLDRPIQLASNAGLSFTGGMNGMLNQIQASIPDGSNADVVNAISEMRAEMNNMANAIHGLQVVMDTGELVGVLTDPIDEQLGWNATLRERRVK